MECEDGAVSEEEEEDGFGEGEEEGVGAWGACFMTSTIVVAGVEMFDDGVCATSSWSIGTSTMLEVVGSMAAFCSLTLLDDEKELPTWPKNDCLRFRRLESENPTIFSICR